jgi:large subunit ribosomal protein L30
MTRLRVTLRRSLIGNPKDQRETARVLGLTKINRTVVRPDNLAIRGMIAKIGHLVRVEEVEAEGKG